MTRMMSARVITSAAALRRSPSSRARAPACSARRSPSSDTATVLLPPRTPIAGFPSPVGRQPVLCQADRCMRRVLLLLVPVAALATLTATGPARGARATGATGAPAWTPPLQWPKWSGGEPRVATHPKDASAADVSPPQPAPAGLNLAAGHRA